MSNWILPRFITDSNTLYRSQNFFDTLFVTSLYVASRRLGGGMGASEGKGILPWLGSKASVPFWSTAVGGGLGYLGINSNWAGGLMSDIGISKEVQNSIKSYYSVAYAVALMASVPGYRNTWKSLGDPWLSPSLPKLTTGRYWLGGGAIVAGLNVATKIWPENEALKTWTKRIAAGYVLVGIAGPALFRVNKIAEEIFTHPKLMAVEIGSKTAHMVGDLAVFNLFLPDIRNALWNKNGGVVFEAIKDAFGVNAAKDGLRTQYAEYDLAFNPNDNYFTALRRLKEAQAERYGISLKDVSGSALNWRARFEESKQGISTSVTFGAMLHFAAPFRRYRGWHMDHKCSCSRFVEGIGDYP
jgi:hypothetical protein